MRYHLEILFICGLALIFAFVLEIQGEERVSLAGLSKYPIPELCFSRTLFEVGCPGCGLTRSFIYLARCDWTAALQMHRLGWLLFLLTVIQIPYRLHALLSKRETLLPQRTSALLGNALIAGLVLNWLIELIESST